MVARSRQFLYSDPVTDLMTGYIDHYIGGAATFQTNYQVMFTVYRGYGTNTGNTVYIPSSELSADYSNIRFADDKGRLLPYWIESSTSVYATVWVLLYDIPTTGACVKILFGGNNLISASNGATTFPTLFDHFTDAALNSNVWATVKGTWEGVTVSGGIVSCTADSNDAHGIKTVANMGTNIAVRAYLKPNHPNNMSYLESLRARYADDSHQVSAYYAHVGAGTNLKYFETNDGVNADYTAITGVSSAQYYTVEAKLGASSVIWTVDGANSVTQSTYYDPISAMVQMTTYANGSKIDCDWILVRKYTDTEPAHGWWGWLEDL